MPRGVGRQARIPAADAGVGTDVVGIGSAIGVFDGNVGVTGRGRVLCGVRVEGRAGAYVSVVNDTKEYRV